MRMQTLFVGNFEFEHRLDAGHADELPESVRRINEDLATVWVAIAGDGDYLLTPAPIEERFFEALSSHGLPRVRPVCDERLIREPVIVCPWGWTDAVRRWAEAHAWYVDAPSQSVVREVNSRGFSFQLERDWGVALAGAAEVHSLDELSEAVQQLPTGDDRWVVKGEFGMSAREQIRSQGRILPEHVANWARKHFKRNGRAFFEPWVERIEEAGLHFTVPRSAPPVLEGITPLLSAPTGEYRGSRFSLFPGSAWERDNDRWTAAVQVGMRAAERVQHTGYFGPLGIDAMLYRNSDGDVRLRPLQDINARWTMGRLSLGFRRLLKPGEVGTWLQLPYKAATGGRGLGRDQCGPLAPRADCQLAERVDHIRSRLGIAQSESGQRPPDVRCIVTSPERIGGRPARIITLIVVASCRDVLRAAEMALLE